MTIDVDFVAGERSSNDQPTSDDSPPDDPAMDDGSESAPQDDSIAPPTVAPQRQDSDSQSDPSGGRGDEQVAVQFVAAQFAELDELRSVEDSIFFGAVNERLPLPRLQRANQVVARIPPNYVAFVDQQLLSAKLDDFQEGLNNGDHTLQLVVGSVAAVASMAMLAECVFCANFRRGNSMTIFGGEPAKIPWISTFLASWAFVPPLTLQRL